MQRRFLELAPIGWQLLHLTMLRAIGQPLCFSLAHTILAYWRSLLLRVNAGEEHTGLSVEQLRDQRLVLRTYRERLITGARAVMQEPIRPLTVERP
jgi:hypothetical protein